MFLHSSDYNNIHVLITRLNYTYYDCSNTCSDYNNTCSDYNSTCSDYAHSVCVANGHCMDENTKRLL